MTLWKIMCICYKMVIEYYDIYQFFHTVDDCHTGTVGCLYGGTGQQTWYVWNDPPSHVVWRPSRQSGREVAFFLKQIPRFFTILSTHEVVPPCWVTIMSHFPYLVDIRATIEIIKIIN